MNINLGLQELWILVLALKEIGPQITDRNLDEKARRLGEKLAAMHAQLVRELDEEHNS
jgi:hypothetical protein